MQTKANLAMNETFPDMTIAAPMQTTARPEAELDAVYTQLFEHLLTVMRDASNRIDDGSQLLYIAKGLECAGDHVTDIAEEVYLMVTSKPLRGPGPG